MFVFTLKASGLKFFVVLALSVTLLATAISVLPTVSAASDVASVNTNYKNIGSEAEMIEFLSNHGYTVDAAPIKVYDMEIPDEFNTIFEKYNDIQRAQGLNLKRYCGKSATVYIYKVTNYEYSGDVFATLFIRNNRIIAGDICSTFDEGFVHGFEKQ